MVIIHISLSDRIAELSSYVPRFIALAGHDRWAKRWRDLGRDFNRSPMLAQIGADYHWLELLLHDQAAALASHGVLEAPLIVDDIAVLHFVAMVVEVHDRLTPQGQTKLQGRLRSALSAETGFAALYLEMDMTRRLFDTGFDVSFPDLDGTAQYDLLFSDARVSGEVECKSLSADAGRKIHRKDFYRLLEPLEAHLLRRAESGAREVLYARLKDRLPAAMSAQRELRQGIHQLARGSAESGIDGTYFSLQRQDFGPSLEATSGSDKYAIYQACVACYGENIHIAGAIVPAGRCLVVMQSEKEDDPSKPWLEAMEKATTQFSGTRPAFVAMQFNDLAVDELMRPHFRRRAEILVRAAFGRPDASHMAGCFICPYRGLLEADGGVAAPAFGLFHLDGQFEINPADYAAFYGTMPDDEFARRIRARQ